MPVDTKVRLLLTGNDVIHSWWVPDFAVKKDAIPGFINEAWFKAEKVGRYTGQCAELCGRDHGFMPIVVRGAVEGGLREVAGREAGGGQGRRRRAARAATTAMTTPRRRAARRGALTRSLEFLAHGTR